MKETKSSNMTAHARYDRRDRMAYVAERIYEDRAEVFCISQSSQSEEKEEVLYTNGALIVRVKATNKIITGFMCDVAKATAVYKKHSGAHAELTRSMRERVKRNYELAQKIK